MPSAASATMTAAATVPHFGAFTSTTRAVGASTTASAAHSKKVLPVTETPNMSWTRYPAAAAQKAEKAEKAAKVDAWRKEVAAKGAAPDPELDKAIAGAAKAKKAKAEKKPREKKAGCLDGAVEVLKAAGGGPLGCKEMVEKMLAKGLWKTDGKTPAATLYSAIIREIATKGKEARFHKADRGRFELAK